MASTVRIPRTRGAGDASRVTASEAKNGFGRVLDRVAREGAVVITKHDRPDAVILSIAEYERLSRSATTEADALTAEFDAMYERMQRPGTAAQIEAVFALSPAELGRIAVKQAAAHKPRKAQAAKRVRRARG
ncbi:MAG: type II toxin-antitoxin system Phd/YefM family antitoxin [Burkholderiales bacterium]